MWIGRRFGSKQRWYDKQAAKRDALAEDARVEAGESGFTLGESLRVTWLLAQRADPELAALLKHASGVPDSRGFRRGDDGLLEKQIVHKAPFPPTFVPVVPKGFAAANMSWRRWMFLQVHIGIFGGHRNEEKTRELLSRLAYWEDSVRDVKEWTERCITCIRFRKRPNKNEMVAVKPMRQEAWEEIMVDCEGPSNPPDLQGNIYVLTYLCLLCHGVLLEPGVNLTHLQLRRMFCRCVFRAGTLPTVLRSDRGPEFKNMLMAEFTALVGIRQKFGTQWRPVEQAAVERCHQELQKLLGLLMQDVLKAFPTEWSELLPVVEFLIYNTPGPHGMTPRDLDRRWSAAHPLEKELAPFESCPLSLCRTMPGTFFPCIGSSEPESWAISPRLLRRERNLLTASGEAVLWK